MTLSHFTLSRTTDGQYLFNLVASNGEIILTGERYHERSSALSGIASVKENAPLDARYDRRQASNGQHYFVLRAGNYEILGTSELYEGSTACEAGIRSVKANAPGAAVESR